MNCLRESSEKSVKATSDDCLGFGANDAKLTSAVTKVQLVWEVNSLTVKLETALSTDELVNRMSS